LSPLEGAGRVEDTLNLLAHAARNLVECAADLLHWTPERVCRAPPGSSQRSARCPVYSARILSTLRCSTRITSSHASSSPRSTPSTTAQSRRSSVRCARPAVRLPS
jgi:hypothetical protein